ncbi:MAG: hypothetical protein WB562_17700, partial [Candidatus Sulfotelmatobacter sp.]
CVTRGELAATVRSARQKKREVHYALDCRNGESRKRGVFLVQRARDASLMPGLWELPEIAVAVMGAGEKQIPRFARNDKNGGTSAKSESDSAPWFTVRHSITITDYMVQVWRVEPPPSLQGKWISVERLGRMALTGLARKILLKAEML